MKASIIFMLCLLFNIAFAQEKEFRWLIGSWKIKATNEIEVWRQDSDGSLKGKSFRVKGGDTTVMELITIEYFDKSFHYIPDVAGDQEPVDFRITSYNKSGFVAENLKHDFPKIIRYRYVKKKEGEFIEATIEGDGKHIPYTLQKVN